MPFAWPVMLVVLILALIVFTAINILQEYERGAVFTLGRFWMIKGPGLVIIVPGIQSLVLVDLRTRVLDVPRQHVISRDNVSVGVSAVVYFRVIDPEKSVIQVENFVAATSQLAQTTLRSVLGQNTLDAMLAERDRLNDQLQATLDRITEQWGVKVANVEIKDVDIDPQMIRSIAAQAEAERTRRAKVIHAEGEFQASQRLADAAKVLSEHPAAVQLRYLQTLNQLAGRGTTRTILFPLPVDLIQGIMRRLSARGARQKP